MRGRGRFRPGPTAKPAGSAKGGGKSPYRLGRDFERATRGRLERRGFFIMRAGLSKGHKLKLPSGEDAHSKIDLLAVKGITVAQPEAMASNPADVLPLSSPSHLIYGIQCKRRGDIGSAEWNELVRVCTAYGITPVVAVKTGERTTGFFRIDAMREPRKPGRPWTAIDPETGEALPEQLTL